MNKSNVAIIIPGGIGTGRNNVGVPVLERIVKLLSIDYNLTVFQLYKVNSDYKVEGFELIDIHSTNAVIRSIKFLFCFIKMQRQRKFKVVHGLWTLPCGFLAVLVGKMFGIRNIVSVLGGDAIAIPEIQYGQLQSPLYRKIIFWTLSSADEVILLTSYLEHNLSKHNFFRKKMKIIPWGIDTTLFSFKEKILSETVQFLHIASLHPVKDQETLLRAFKTISDIIESRLVIIGEGISEDYIRDLIVELDLQSKVSMLGLLAYEELPAYYHKADVLLHTSLSEGQSEVVTEAMSCGVLVCGTKVGLMYDLPECCISVSVSVRDHDALAALVVHLLKDPDKMRMLRSNASQWTKSHSMQWTVDKIKEVYNFHSDNYA